VTASGELAIAAMLASAGSVSNSGSYTDLEPGAHGSDNMLLGYKTAPTVGSTTTAAITAASGNWWAALIAFKP